MFPLCYSGITKDSCIVGPGRIIYAGNGVVVSPCGCLAHVTLISNLLCEEHLENCGLVVLICQHMSYSYK
jgi:hypothetical protein